MFNKDIQSDEEVYADWFFEELKTRGYIKEIINQPDPFKLFDGAKYPWRNNKPTKKEPDRFEVKESWLFEPAEYTADKLIHWTNKADGVFYNLNDRTSPKSPLFIGHYGILAEDNVFSYIEVKPIFDDNNMTREVILKHKWVYQKYGIYVNMFIRDKVMPKLFTPQRYILSQVYKKTTNTKRGLMTPGMSKIQWKVRTLDEYLQSLST